MTTWEYDATVTDYLRRAERSKAKPSARRRRNTDRTRTVAAKAARLIQKRAAYALTGRA